MIEIPYLVKQHHMDQVLTYSRALPEAPASNLGHPCTCRFLCSCWEELPTPRPRGAQQLSLRRRNKKILLKNHSSPLQSCHKREPGWIIMFQNWHLTCYCDYLSHRFLIRAEPIFFITSYLIFFPYWRLKRCKPFWPVISKVPALKNSTSPSISGLFNNSHIHQIPFAKRTHTELKPRAALIKKSHWKVIK